MVTIERTSDIDMIKSIVSHNDIYPFISDDYSPLATDYEPIIDDSIYWLLIKNSGVLCGLFMIHQSNGITCELHTCVLPECRGSKTTLYTKKLFDWIFENTQFKKVITHVPSFNSAALLLAEKSGMTREGINRLSFLKTGQIYDQFLLGKTYQEWTSCH
jgi:RimJ/RimL family protein N-acetyltransferase